MWWLTKGRKLINVEGIQAAEKLLDKMHFIPANSKDEQFQKKIFWP